MRDRAKAAVIAGFGRVLEAAGYRGIELDLARRDTVDWAKARAGSVRSRRGVVGGQAVVISAPGRVELHPIERVLAGPGEVSVEVLVSAISAGTERAEWLRLPNLQPELPYTPGYSGVGRVLASGPGPHHVAPGSLVAVARLRHASVATVPAEYAIPVPDAVAPAHAALVYLAMIAGWGVQRAGLGPGEPLCVIGAGPIGALAQRLALLAGAGPITVVAKTRRRADAALRAGASAYVTLDEGVDVIRAPVVIEATGDPAAIATAVAAAGPGGTVVLLGSPWAPTRDVPVAEIQAKRLRLVGAHISSLATVAKSLPHDPFRVIGEQFLAALADGRVVVDDLVGEAVDPREIRLLYRRLSRGEVTAAHLDWCRIPREERVRSPRLLSLPALPVRAPAVDVPRPLVRSGRGARHLRFAVIGCGDIGDKNARAIARSTNAGVALCFDPVADAAEATARSHGGAAARTLDEALDPSRVDAVFLSVPHDLHTSLVERAADAGLHVIVEKPLSIDLGAARDAVAAAERAGVVLSVCFPFRYEAPLVAARSFVQAGALGPLRGAAVVFHDDQPDAYWTGGFSGRVASDWRSRRERSGGGILIMSLIHQIDFLRYVLGTEIDAVSAVALTRPGDEVEDAVSMTLTFRDGGIGSMLGSASTRGRPAGRFELWGETGTVRLVPDEAIYSERSIPGLTPGRWCALPPDDGSDPRAVFVERFVDAIVEGRPPDVTAEDGLAAQAVVEAGYRSMASGAPVSVASLLEAQA